MFMSTVIYLRQSKDRDGEEFAIDRQRKQCHALAESLGLTISREFVDNNKSATSGPRPAFQELMSAIEADAITHLIVVATDRLYRLMRDLVPLIDTIRQHPLTIHAVSGGQVDLSTIDGQTMAYFFGIGNELEGKRKGLRQVAANKQRAEKGLWQFSRRPFGYDRVNGEVVLVEAEAAILREAYERFISGETYYSICRSLNERGLKAQDGQDWTMANLRLRLMNPAYAGLRLYKGQIFAKGTWTPVIDESTFDAFQTAVKRRAGSAKGSKKTKYLLSGYARCGVCGGVMFARPEYRTNKDGSKVTTMSYACKTNWCTSRLMDVTDEIVEAAIIGRLSQPDASVMLAPEVNLEPLMARAVELRARKDDLASALAEGVLTLNAVKEASKRLSDELAKVQSQIDSAQGNPVVADLLGSDDIEIHWRDKLNFQQRRGVVEALVTVTIQKQKNTRIFDPASIQVTWKTDSVI
jgi:site-specific DNA recombinase